MTIWKFPLRVTDSQLVLMPEGAKILCVQVQDATPCLWAKIDPNLAPTPRKIETRGTGHDVGPQCDHYIGTYQLHGGALVFHVFDDSEGER